MVRGRRCLYPAGAALFAPLLGCQAAALSGSEVGLPLLVGLAVGYWYYRSRRGTTSTQRVLSRAEAERRRTSVRAADVVAWTTSLKATDPAFDLLQFFDRVKSTVLGVHEACARRTLDPVRRYLSDGTASRLSVQLGLGDPGGQREACAGLRVLDLQIIGLEQSGCFDTLQVRVKAQASGNPSGVGSEPILEVWSLMRRPGARTSARGLLQGVCPGCGAPFGADWGNVCQACQAIVNSGTHDWVVGEITPDGAHQPPHQAIDGFARARKSDPDLSSEVLEDRASLCFWRWIEAQAKDDPTRLTALALPDLVAGLTSEGSALRAQGRRKVYAECAVGGSNTLSLTQDHGCDLAHVEVRWSARLGVIPREAPSTALPLRPQRSVLTLQRSSGAVSSTSHGLSTDRCPRCAVSLSQSASPACEVCAAPLATGDHDWVLREVRSWEAWNPVSVAQGGAQPRRLADRVPDQRERERLLSLMAQVAACDGSVHQRERALLQMSAERWGVPWDSVEEALSADPALVQGLIAKGSVEAESFLRELVQLAMVDGRVDRRERQFLEAAASHLGLAHRLPALLRSSV